MLYKSCFIFCLAFGSLDAFNEADQRAFLGEVLQQSVGVMCSLSNQTNMVKELNSTAKTYQTCMNNAVKLNTFEESYNTAIKEKAMIALAEKVCSKVSEMKKCFTDVIDKFKPCLAIVGSNAEKNIKNGLDAALNYICFNNYGDRLENFLYHKGLECVETNMKRIALCALLAEKLPKLTKESTTEEYCRIFKDFSQCADDTLKYCQQPNNIIQYLLFDIRQAGPCKFL